jgi:ABC-type nitrate/sulfonate/bicarbonate transport system substrate-binding protein
MNRLESGSPYVSGWAKADGVTLATPHSASHNQGLRRCLTEDGIKVDID